MEEIAISKFKATCPAVLEQVRRTRKPVRVTRYGKPVAEVMPPSGAKRRLRNLGSMRDNTHILGDIVSPVVDLQEWEVLHR
jgi:prevent-host-death family protein